MISTSMTAAPAPDPTRVGVEGTLDAVRHGDRTFALILGDGRGFAGRLARGKMLGLARLLGRKLVVFGEGQFDAAGGLVGVEADGYIPADGAPWVRPKSDPPLPADARAELERILAEFGRARPTGPILGRLVPPKPLPPPLEPPLA